MMFFLLLNVKVSGKNWAFLQNIFIFLFYLDDPEV